MVPFAARENFGGGGGGERVVPEIALFAAVAFLRFAENRGSNDLHDNPVNFAKTNAHDAFVQSFGAIFSGVKSAVANAEDFGGQTGIDANEFSQLLTIGFGIIEKEKEFGNDLEGRRKEFCFANEAREIFSHGQAPANAA